MLLLSAVCRPRLQLMPCEAEIVTTLQCSYSNLPACHTRERHAAVHLDTIKAGLCKRAPRKGNKYNTGDCLSRVQSTSCCLARLHRTAHSLHDSQQPLLCRARQSSSSGALWRTASCASQVFSKGGQLACAARPASTSICASRASTGANSRAAKRSPLRHMPALACALPRSVHHSCVAHTGGTWVW